jgi:hypothetical protein
MFRTSPLPITRSFSLYTQQWYMSYRFIDSLWAGSGWNWWNQFHPDPAHKPSTNLYDINHCCVYSEKLLMIDRGTVRNIYRVSFRRKFEKLVHLVGFIIRPWSRSTFLIEAGHIPTALFICSGFSLFLFALTGIFYNIKCDVCFKTKMKHVMECQRWCSKRNSISFWPCNDFFCTTLFSSRIVKIFNFSRYSITAIVLWKECACPKDCSSGTRFQKTSSK